MKASRCLTMLTAPFAPHLADPAVTEVVVNRPGQYGVERAGKWEWHDAPELTFQRLDAIGLAAAAETSQDFSWASPLCGARLPSGERVQINRPPATHDDVITLAIRRPFADIDDDEDDEVFEETNTGASRKEVASAELVRLFEARDWKGFLRRIPEERLSIGICGAQGSGKTTRLIRMMRHIPRHLRIATIEDDSPEFGNAGPPNKIAFFYGRAGLTPARVGKAALRMRADSVIYQEIRGDEAYFLIQGAMRGANIMTTWHAEMGREFDALATMYRQSEFGRTISHDDLMAQIKGLIDVIIWQYRDARAEKFRPARIWFRGMEEKLT